MLAEKGLELDAVIELKVDEGFPHQARREAAIAEMTARGEPLACRMTIRDALRSGIDAYRALDGAARSAIMPPKACSRRSTAWRRSSKFSAAIADAARPFRSGTSSAALPRRRPSGRDPRRPARRPRRSSARTAPPGAAARLRRQTGSRPRCRWRAASRRPVTTSKPDADPRKGRTTVKPAAISAKHQTSHADAPRDGRQGPQGRWAADRPRQGRGKKGVQAGRRQVASASKGKSPAPPENRQAVGEVRQ